LLDTASYGFLISNFIEIHNVEIRVAVGGLFVVNMCRIVGLV